MYGIHSSIEFLLIQTKKRIRENDGAMQRLCSRKIALSFFLNQDREKDIYSYAF